MSAVVSKNTQNLNGLTHSNLFLTLKTFTASPSALQDRYLTNSDLETQVAFIHLIGMSLGAHCFQVTMASKERTGESMQDFLWLHSRKDTTSVYNLSANPLLEVVKWHCLPTMGWEVMKAHLISC